MSWELVIRLGRPFDVKAEKFSGDPRGLMQGVSRIVVPFATRESADAAMAELTMHINKVTEDFGPKVIQGEVVKDHDHDQQLGDRHVEALPEAVVPHVLPGDGPG